MKLIGVLLLHLDDVTTTHMHKEICIERQFAFSPQIHQNDNYHTNET